MRHPFVADRDCQVCLIYNFNEETGQFVLDRFGQPDKRFVATRPPCQTNKGCPKGTPENQRTLKTDPRRWYDEYLECKAVKSFPDDPYVRRIAAIIADVEQDFEYHRQNEFHSTLITLAVRSRQ